MFGDGALTFREFATREPLPLATIHDAVLDFLRGRDDAVLYGAQAVNAYVDESRMTHLFFDAGNGGFIAYFVINEGTDLVISPAKEGVGAMGHLALNLAGPIEGAMETLDDNGIKYVGPVDRGYERSIYFRDPNNVLVELLTWITPLPEGGVGSHTEGNPSTPAPEPVSWAPSVQSHYGSVLTRPDPAPVRLFPKPRTKFDLRRPIHQGHGTRRIGPGPAEFALCTLSELKAGHGPGRPDQTLR